jgi:hypothetical protein
VALVKSPSIETIPNPPLVVLKERTATMGPETETEIDSPAVAEYTHPVAWNAPVATPAGLVVHVPDFVHEPCHLWSPGFAMQISLIDGTMFAAVFVPKNIP